MNWSGTKKQEPAFTESGVMAVEFVLLLPFFLLILVGVMEFGHLWNVRQIMTNAGREAARAAVVAPPKAETDRSTWATELVIKVLNNNGFNLDKEGAGTYKSLPNASFKVAATAGSKTGDSVKVTITASNIVLALGDLVPAFNKISFSSQTTMRME